MLGSIVKHLGTSGRLAIVLLGATAAADQSTAANPDPAWQLGRREAPAALARQSANARNLPDTDDGEEAVGRVLSLVITPLSLAAHGLAAYGDIDEGR